MKRRLPETADSSQAADALVESEAKFQSFFEHSMDAMLLTRPDGSILTANPAACAMFGRTEEQIVRGGRALVVDATDPRMGGLLAERAASGRARGEMIMLRADGTRFPVEVSSAIFKDRTGVDCTSMIVRDLTHEKQAEEALRESEERYRQLLEVSPVGIAVQQDGRVVFANPAGARLLGEQSPEGLIGRPISQIIHPDDWEAARDHIRRMLAGELGLYPIEHRYVRRDGTSVEVEVMAAPLLFRGKPAVQVVVMDISERKSLERRLLQAQKMESLGTLAGGIAHDFNNILAIIVGHAELLGRAAPDLEVLSRAREAILRAGQRGSDLVQRLLAFARHSEKVIQPVCVNAVVEELVKMLRETFPRAIEVTTDLADGLPVIAADPTQVNQVLLNLCVNARDAMPKGGLLCITTRLVPAQSPRERNPAARAASFIALDVRDTGTGMDEETLQRVFEPFYTRKEFGKGSGLGLAMVYGIVTGMGGSLEVESAVGRGTAVHVYLPVTALPAAEPARPEPEGEPPGGNETILVVEDEEMLRDLLRAVLEPKGYTVIEAADGPVGIAAFEANRASIGAVVTDLGLPRLGGDEVAARIKAADPSARVILASGFIPPETREQLSRIGVRHFIQKPYAADRLLQALREAIDDPRGGR
jgi:two-component system cell cycle sensor histidine kinase/response regulator CckA